MIIISPCRWPFSETTAAIHRNGVLFYLHYSLPTNLDMSCWESNLDNRFDVFWLWKQGLLYFSVDFP